MLKREVDYSILPTRAAMRDAAIRDIKSYLGDDQWAKIEEAYHLREDDEGYFNVTKCSVRKQIRVGLQGVCHLMLGIEGYAVIALQSFILKHHLDKIREART